MSNNEQACGNPECDQLGKLRCSRCAKVSYCGAECQKKHWSAHKAACKSAKASSTTTAVTETKTPSTGSKSNPTEIWNQLKQMKQEKQVLFTQGQFQKSIEVGEKAVLLAKQLPPHVAVMELVQLHVNIGNAYTQLQNLAAAEKSINESIECAESALKQRPDHPQSLEVMHVALNSKAFLCLNLQKIEEADTISTRSLAIAEKIYPKTDPRLHKVLRIQAITKTKLNDLEKAEKLYYRAYTILCLAEGAHHPESNIIFDEFIKLLIQKGDIVSAEKHARNNYKTLLTKQSSEVGLMENEGFNMIVADSCARVATVLRHMNNLIESERHFEQALILREKFKIVRRNPLILAFNLVQLVGVQEAAGTLTDESEVRLQKAAEIFTRLKGPDSPEMKKILLQLRSIREKRKREGSAEVDVEEDGEDLITSSESTSPKTPSNTGSRGSTSTNPSLNGVKKVKNPSSDKTKLYEEFSKLSFSPTDAVGRMMKANDYFESAEYSYAEVLIREAFEIFREVEGVNSQRTQAAEQNLQVVRNNALNKLWLEIVTEEVMKMGESKQVGEETDESEQNDYEKLISNKGSSNNFLNPL